MERNHASCAVQLGAMERCLAVLASKHVLDLVHHPHLCHRPPLDFWAEFALLDNLSPGNAEELLRIP